MEMQASRTLAVSQQQAWEALNDPEVLKLCIPGCDKFAPAGNNQYAVAMAVKIGPVSAKFAGKITLADIVRPRATPSPLTVRAAWPALARARRGFCWCRCPLMGQGRTVASSTTRCMPAWAARSPSWASA